MREDIPKALNLVKSSTILGHYKSYLKKIDLYKENIVYEARKWKKLIFHEKTWCVNDDR